MTLLRVGLALTLSLGIISIAHSADACGYPNTEHCWGQAQWLDHANHGARVTINTDCLYAPDGGGNGFITDELWVIRNGNWIEAGFIYGLGNDSRYFFWGDSRPNWPFSFHPEYSLPDNLHVDWDVSITHAAVGSPNWKVWQNLTLVGTSTDNFTSAANELHTGSETSRDDARTDATSHHLDWRGAAGNYNSDWRDGPSVSTLAAFGPNNTYNVSWGNVYARVNYADHKSSC